MADPRKEKTLLLIKPDGVRRALIGQILSRIENCGLKIIGIKFMKPNEDHIRKHYPMTKEWMTGLGNKTLEGYKEHNIDPIKKLGTADPHEIGKMVAQWNIKTLSSEPIVAVAIKGLHAVETVRKIVGPTVPAMAQLGTIRGDFSVDSVVLANSNKRPLKNIVHAAGTISEAKKEIRHWFKKKELLEYKRVDEEIMFD